MNPADSQILRNVLTWIQHFESPEMIMPTVSSGFLCPRLVLYKEPTSSRFSCFDNCSFTFEVDVSTDV